MLLIEGPRESGKTSLCDELALHFALPVYHYPLALNKPYDLNEIVADVRSWNTKPVGIYVSHPLIDEYIYGPLIRKRIFPEFDSWKLKTTLTYVREKTLVIYCRPSIILDDPALPFFDLLLKSPLSPFNSWVYDYIDDPDTKKLRAGLKTKLYNLRLEAHHRKLGSRKNGYTL